jgi:hypothetical protein
LFTFFGENKEATARKTREIMFYLNLCVIPRASAERCSLLHDAKKREREETEKREREGCERRERERRKKRETKTPLKNTKFRGNRNL